MCKWTPSSAPERVFWKYWGVGRRVLSKHVISVPLFKESILDIHTIERRYHPTTHPHTHLYKNLQSANEFHTLQSINSTGVTPGRPNDYIILLTSPHRLMLYLPFLYWARPDPEGGLFVSAPSLCCVALLWLENKTKAWFIWTQRGRRRVSACLSLHLHLYSCFSPSTLSSRPWRSVGRDAVIEPFNIMQLWHTTRHSDIAWRVSGY